jgi:hypothetical protein
MKCKKILCGTHGKSDAHVVCQHLLDERGLQYLLIPPRPDLPYWQAFCEKCLAVVDEEVGWTDRALSFARHCIICAGCFKKKIRRHEVLRCTCGCAEKEHVVEGA